MKLIPSLLAGALALGMTGVAVAGTATTTFPVTATVDSACSVVAQNLQFPNVGNISAESGFAGASAQTSIYLTCNDSNATPVTLELDAQPLTNVGDGTTVMAYGLFQDASLTTPWGTTAQGESQEVAGGLGQKVLTVYGQIPAQPNVIAGFYEATINITATY